MKTTRTVTVRELFKGYVDLDDNGVTAMSGKLNIRPAYQREFVYDKSGKEEVIYSILEGVSLKELTWSKKGFESFENMDGQQRTMSIMGFLKNEFLIKRNGALTNFDGLSDTDKDMITNYTFMVTVYEKSEDEVLRIFRRLNVAGKTMSEQELLNSRFIGKWLNEAKRRFSARTNNTAIGLAGEYLTGDPKRQGVLEKALLWVSNDNIEEYMATHRFDDNADELWNDFRDIVKWIEETFPNTRAIMKKVNWGDLYHKSKGKNLNPEELEDLISKTLMTDGIEKVAGVYAYAITGRSKHLYRKVFSKDEKFIEYERQNGMCKCCGNKFDFNEMQGDHIIPRSKGGPTTVDNLQMLCNNCNLDKSND